MDVRCAPRPSLLPTAAARRLRLADDGYRASPRRRRRPLQRHAHPHRAQRGCPRVRFRSAPRFTPPPPTIMHAYYIGFIQYTHPQVNPYVYL